MKAGDLVKIKDMVHNLQSHRNLKCIVLKKRKARFGEYGLVCKIYTGKEILEYHEERLEVINESR